MENNTELPFIDNKEYLSAEFRRLREVRSEKKKVKAKAKNLKKAEKMEVFEKTNCTCHLCGNKLNGEKFSISFPFVSNGLVADSLPACRSCKRLYGNYLPSEIKWIMKLGMWARTQIEYETEIGQDIAIELVETESDRERSRKEPRKPITIDVSKYPVKDNTFISKRVKQEYKTIREVLYWSYANLAMAYKACDDGVERYTRMHYAIRFKLFKGLISEKMSVSSLFKDEKSKLNSDRCCVYCGKTRNLQLDHLIPRNKGGKDTGDNLVLACRSCNASKSDTDLIEWLKKQSKFPALHILRNYMKLVIQYCQENNLIDEDLDTALELNLPFAIEFIPLEYPQPNKLKYRIEK